MSSTTERRLVPFSFYARHRGRADRTVRLWVSKGLLPAYKVPGVRAALVDIDEADAILDSLPNTVIRKAFGSLGPNADVRTLDGAL